MSHSTTFEVLHLERPATPRGAILVGLLYGAFTALVRHPSRGTAHAAPRVREASVVRRMADRLACSDPALAADLYAAAGRHERLDEERALR